MRTFLVIYVVSLHMLVFLTTYNWSHMDGCTHVSNEDLSHLPPVMPASVSAAKEAVSPGG
jgi:hypothetical protein